uniref:Virion structural protein n=1 Tax=Pseudomonas phage RVTF4 TaxID=3236931 RepID=A0AB39CCH9_9VIRU
MARLKELAAVYADEDKCIPLEYFTPTGEIIRGVVQRVLDNDVCLVVTQYVDQAMTVKVETHDFAGPARPGTWCLSRTANAMHASLGDPKFSEITAKSQQIVELTWGVMNQFFTPKLATFKSWDGHDLLNVAGFIQLSEGTVDRSGFIIRTDGTPPEFVKFLSKTAVLTYFK